MKIRPFLILLLFTFGFPFTFGVGRSVQAQGESFTIHLPYIANRYTQTGSVQGQVMAAGFDFPVPDATVCVLSTDQCATGDADGNYLLDEVPIGLQTLQASALGLFTEEATIAVQKDSTSTLDFELARSATLGKIQIVLTWESRSDLDAHLWLPSMPPLPPAHIYWDNLGDCTLLPYACLDKDDFDGFGPETITVKEGLPGLYSYAVYKFSPEGELPWFQPKIQIFDDLGLVVEFQVPSEGSGRWWYVFDWLIIDFDLMIGNITVQNFLTRTSPGP